MGTSVLQCRLCRKFYKDFFEDKKRMKLVARIHRNGHETANAPQGQAVVRQPHR